MGFHHVLALPSFSDLPRLAPYSRLFSCFMMTDHQISLPEAKHP